jgi:hypothetical protein
MLQVAIVHKCLSVISEMLEDICDVDGVVKLRELIV